MKGYGNMVGGILLTHAVAHQTGKSPFFFSRFTFERAKARGNTHYCFDCGGEYGFKPGKNGQVTNSADAVANLEGLNGKFLLVRQALLIPELEPFLAMTPGYTRRNPNDRNYEEWLEYQAYFDYSEALQDAALSTGYEIRRYDSMAYHMPDHDSAVLGNMNRFRWASDWLESELRSRDFPYIVHLT